MYGIFVLRIWERLTLILTDITSLSFKNANFDIFEITKPYKYIEDLLLPRWMRDCEA